MQLTKRIIQCSLLGVAGMWASAFGGPSQAAEAQVATGFVGQNGFLFYRYEFAQANDAPDTMTTLNLLAKISQQFAANGVTLALVPVPSKIRIYADQLPASNKLDPYTDAKYETAVKYLRNQQVNVVNLNQAFLRSPLRMSDTPLFLRLDTHWSPTGAALAADTVREEVMRNPVLKQAWEATPPVAYQFALAANKINKRERDLIPQLPKGAPEFPIEQVLPFKVTRDSKAGAGLLDGAAPVLVTAIGSSYTDAITGYPDAVRHALQRDVLDISIPVLRGPWVGMETYLQDASFQRNPPALLIWEIPERELRSPPNYRFREPRYISDNQEWLTRTAALVQKQCQLAPNKIIQTEAGGQVLRFEPPLGPLDYVRFLLPPQRPSQWQFEASNKSGAKRNVSLAVPDDEQAFEVKLALPHLAGGVEQLNLNAKSAALAKDWQVCRLPATLLEK